MYSLVAKNVDSATGLSPQALITPTPMNRHTLYWICQLGGWSLFVTYELAGYFSYGAPLSKLLVNGAINVLLGIGITHAYRYVVIRREWSRLPLQVLAPRALLVVVFITLALNAVNLQMDQLMFPQLFEQANAVLVFVVGFLNWGKYILLWVAFYHLFLYAERNARVELEKSEIQRQVVETELQRLRSQMNPHFLFNALNSLRALVLEDPEAAQNGLTRLAKLLRQALKNDHRRTLPLKSELQVVENYLELEKLRLEDRLQVRWELAPGTGAVEVPSLLVLTLVENAIKHGIANQPSGGEIRFTSYFAHHQFVLEIRNAGTYAPATAPDGFGLPNSIERLQLIFGKSASLKIGQEAPGQVLTRLVLPAAARPNRQTASPAAAPQQIVNRPTETQNL